MNSSLLARIATSLSGTKLPIQNVRYLTANGVKPTRYARSEVFRLWTPSGHSSRALAFDFEHPRGELGHETNRIFGGRVRYCRGDRNSSCATFEASKWPFKKQTAENWTSSKLDLWPTHECNLWSSYRRPSELAGLLDRAKILGRPRFVGYGRVWRSGRNVRPLLRTQIGKFKLSHYAGFGHFSELNAAVVAAQSDAATRQRLLDQGVEPPPRELQTLEAFGAFHKAEVEKWWPFIKAAGIKAQ